jgi:LCP family protein required for cell wall assembly
MRMPDPGQPVAPPPERPEYRVYRTRPRLFSRGSRDGASVLEELRRRPDGGRPGRRRPLTVGRVVKWVVLAVVAWLVLSLALFLISATFVQDRVSGEARGQLAGGKAPIVSATTVLVLGSDQRPKGSKEPGAATSGPSRSDSILLMRVGGGHSAKLSIPRDTVVDIPGHGRDKINAAFAIGGAALSIRTVREYLGIPIDHVIQVNFARFPSLVDAMGGIDYTGSCVVSRINGGFKNGGFTLRLRRGTTHIDGKQALALARTRHNLCNKRENDLTRARRQQKILSAMKSRAFSLAGFIRLPWIAWNAPKAVSTDMRGPGMFGLALSILTSGSGATHVLRPSGGVTLPNGGAGLVVSSAEKQREVHRFLSG